MGRWGGNGLGLRRLCSRLGVGFGCCAGFFGGFTLALGFVEQVALVVVQVAVKRGHAAARDHPEFIAHGAQQGAVVADQHHGAFKFIERHAQGLAGGQIQVVGGFVQQQQVGALPDDHAQHQAGFFAAAHAAHGLFDHVAAEIEVAQKAAQVLLARGLSGDFSQSGEVFDQLDHVLQRSVGQAQHIELLLGKVADVQALAFGDVAADRLQGARHSFDQG